jgi:hypothetical protein
LKGGGPTAVVGFFERAVVMLLVALVLSVLAMTSSMPAAVIFSGHGILATFQSTLWLLCCNLVWSGLLALLFLKRWQLPVFLASQLIFTAFLLLDLSYYAFYQEHFNLWSLALIFRAYLAGEAGDESVVSPLGAAIFALGFVGAGIGLHLGLRRVPWPRLAFRRAVVVAAAPLALVALTIGADRALFPRDAEPLRPLQRNIPWFPVPDPWPDYTLFEQPLEVGDGTEIANLEHLARARRGIVDGVRCDYRPDIVVLHVEGLRHDMVDRAVMPELWRLIEAGELEHLPRHYSTGNQTGTAHLGLLHGLSPYYHRPARELDFTPIPLEILEALGYRQSTYFIRKPSLEDELMWNRAWELYFEPTSDHHYIPPFGDIAEIEGRMVDRYLADLDAAAPPAAPRFDYLIFYSSHYDFYYPPAYEKFTPVKQLGFEITSGQYQHMRAFRDGIFNRYRNSLGWVDHLVARIVRKLEQRGRFDDTVLVVTGDHGEEFWEQGRFGHTFGLSNEQIQTGTAVRFPGGLRTRYSITSHADLFPTIFQRMGLDRDLTTFMTGKSLLEHDPARDLAVAATDIYVFASDKYAVVGPELKIHYVNSGDLEAERITAADDEPIPAELDRDAARALLVAAVNEKRLTGAPNPDLPPR